MSGDCRDLLGDSLLRYSKLFRDGFRGRTIRKTDGDRDDFSVKPELSLTREDFVNCKDPTNEFEDGEPVEGLILRLFLRFDHLIERSLPSGLFDELSGHERPVEGSVFTVEPEIVFGIRVEPGLDQAFPVFVRQAVEKLFVSRFETSDAHREGKGKGWRVRRLLRSRERLFRGRPVVPEGGKLSLEENGGEFGIGLPFGFPTRASDRDDLIHSFGRPFTSLEQVEEEILPVECLRDRVSKETEVRIVRPSDDVHFSLVHRSRD